MMIGRTLAHYTILKKLGSGGMGEVYIAEDKKLGRKVALKILPPDMAENAERRARFEREAKAVAALDHPNIVTIYSVEEAEGVHFYTMQLVKGKTLTELISKKGMVLDKFFEIAIPLADAVSAAHEQGIIHRDLKPDNLMSSDDGRLKILDFGLAKLKPQFTEEGASELPTQSATAEGRILGTVAYMSPEQAEGKQIDNRSDIFSIGIILYEMATGERPFKGDTTVSLLSSILKDEPISATDVNPALPHDLGKVIRRCLVKDKEHRYQTAKDVRNELEELKKELDSGILVPAEQAVGTVARLRKSTWLWLASLLVVFVVTVASLLNWARPEYVAPSPNLIHLTAQEGIERDPALSPDGNQVAFVWNGGDDGHFQLYVKLISGGEPLQLTTASTDHYSPVWSPDGHEIALLRERKDQAGSEVIVISALGGSERRLGITQTKYEEGPIWVPGLDWSPSGDMLAIADKNSPDDQASIFLLNKNTGSKLQLTSPPVDSTTRDNQPAFSPDGQAVAFVRTRDDLAWSQILLKTLDGEEQKVLTKDLNGMAIDIAWTANGSAIIYSIIKDGLNSLWRLSAEGGVPAKLPFGENAQHLSIARGGASLAYSQRPYLNADLWRANGPHAQHQIPPTKLPSSTRIEYGQQISPDGKKIAFVSGRSGANAVWVCDSNGENWIQLGDGHSSHPRWSPDGMAIAYRQTYDGNPDIYVINVQSGFKHRLTDEDSVDDAPAWSSDGEWIYFSSNRSGDFQVWRMPAAGGNPVQITQNGGRFSWESPDGKYLYYSRQRHGPSTRWCDIYRISLEGGNEELVLEDRQILPPDWTLWNDNIVYQHLAGEKGWLIDMYDLQSGQTNHLAELGFEEPGYCATVSPDGTWIVYTKPAPRVADIMLVENFQ
jgi:serine/threonine protein kinase/Tol biopolymer transport system component